MTTATKSKEIEEKSVPEQTFFSFRTDLESTTDVPEHAEVQLPRLQAAMAHLGLQAVGPVHFFYYNLGAHDKTPELEIAFPIEAEAGQAGEFLYRTIPGHTCYAVTYVGAMPGIMQAWGAFLEGIKPLGKKPTGLDCEVYHKWVDFESPENVTELRHAFC